jgi:hypothetical protein
MGEGNRKIVYVYAAERFLFEPISPIARAVPPAPDYVIGTGHPIAIVEHVKKLMREGYELVLDRNSNGEKKPLREIWDFYSC